MFDLMEFESTVLSLLALCIAVIAPIVISVILHRKFFSESLDDGSVQYGSYSNNRHPVRYSSNRTTGNNSDIVTTSTVTSSVSSSSSSSSSSDCSSSCDGGAM